MDSYLKELESEDIKEKEGDNFRTTSMTTSNNKEKKNIILFLFEKAVSYIIGDYDLYEEEVIVL